MSNQNEKCDDNGQGNGGKRTVLALSAVDQQLLAHLEAKLQVVRDFTAGVAVGRTTGMYVFGAGGIGKSYVVLKELERLEVPFRLFNSRMTGRGLYNALEASPDSIHVLEDMEQLFRDRGAMGVLRSALWSLPTMNQRGLNERLVTWTSYKMEHRFVFTGGLIMAGNRPFPPLPELEAIKTRIAYDQLVVSDKEIIAKMRQISLRGYCDNGRMEEMEPAECMDVCDFIVRQSLGLRRPLDLRVLIHGFQDYLQWRDCGSGCHWHDLVATRIKERPTALVEVKTIGARASEKAREQEFARQIMDHPREDRFQEWYKLTGKSEKALYRRLMELARMDSHIFEK